MKNSLRVWWPHVVLAVSYTGLILGVAFLVVNPRISSTQVQSFRQIQFRATRDLLRNHRVRPRDIERPADLAGSLHWYLPRTDRLEGMYIKQRVGRGEPVCEEDVQAWPDLVTRHCCTAIPISLQDQPLLTELLNVESRVNVCPQVGECVASARVQAVICGKQEASCYAVLDVLKKDEARVREAGAKGKLQLMLIAFQDSKGAVQWANRPGDP